MIVNVGSHEDDDDNDNDDDDDIIVYSRLTRPCFLLLLRYLDNFG